MMRFALILLLLLAPVASIQGGVTTAWSLDNVLTTVEVDGTGVSEVFDRPPADPGAETFGLISFDGEEGFNPGMEVVNDAAPGVPPSPSDAFNCLMAVAVTSCNGDFQDGKRFKLNRTGFGPVDVVLDHDSNGTYTTPGNDGTYRAFMKYANLTGERLFRFDLLLGTGVGEGYVPSSLADALLFVDFGPAPTNNELSALFPNGLFGTGTLPGYFSTQRAGFELVRVDEDRIEATGQFGPYAELFGDWMPLSEVPDGYFYDDDGNPDSDNILIAHFDMGSAQWIQNRSLDMPGTVGVIAGGNDGTPYVDLMALESALIQSSGLAICPEIPDGQPCLAGVDLIEDLSKFNVTLFVDTFAYAADEFTFRVTATRSVLFADSFETIP